MHDECEENLDDGCEECQLIQCGNGEADVGEQCDPKKPSDKQNGCLEHCMWPPDGVEFEGLSLAYVLGVAGGDPVEHACDAGAGLYGHYDGVNEQVAQIAAICGQYSLVAPWPKAFRVDIVATDVAGDLVGEPVEGADPFSLECPGERVPVGVLGEVDAHIRTLSLICAEERVVRIKGQWSVFGRYPVVVGPLGGDSDSEVIKACNEGDAIESFSFYTDNSGKLTGVGIHCRKLVVKL